MRIACLHTVDANIAVFDRAAAGQGLTLTHHVRADLLRTAEAEGGASPAVERQTADALLRVAPTADAVLLTCSTIGRGAEIAAAEASIPIVRVDEALARDVAQRGGRAMVLCAAETTLGPTRALFERVAKGAPVTLDFALVPGAWALYRSGDVAAYGRAIAAAADKAYADGYDTVALAQASMASAVPMTERGVPLTSPAAGLARVSEAARAAG